MAERREGCYNLHTNRCAETALERRAKGATMHIQYVEIGNFRKLKAVRIDFAETNTVFVGANNSGKTSAMVALRRFLVDRAEFSINDFTLTHWAEIDAIATAWEVVAEGEPIDALDWSEQLPFLDVWLNVPTKELHYVQRLLPTLDWDGACIGVRLRLEPKEGAALQQEYLTARKAAVAVLSSSAGGVVPPAAIAPALPGAGPAKVAAPFALWPRSMMDFLSRRLRSTFEVRAYLLDPTALQEPLHGIARPQPLPDLSEAIEGNPFHGLIQIDEISAQRGFGHSGSASTRGDDAQDDSTERTGKKLSTQLRSYFTQHLDPFDMPEPKDLQALKALHEAQAAFGDRLSDCFAEALEELETIGYPGVTDPKLTITTNIKPVDSLNHGSAVQYEVPTHLAPNSKGHRLPEDSNGLGYQNLVSMVFALMSFRDRWMKVGKAGKAATNSAEAVSIPPLHLVLIEEPEAHLHAQVQQVFIKQAYDILRKHDKLKDSKDLRTQLVVSTHSSHLAHEADFASLRYFRRLAAPSVAGAVPTSSVVNLSRIFGGTGATERFVRRYLKATHCDLFFADGAILVEGPAERILIPHLVRERDAYAYLRRCYVTWLEIGGSHAHTLRALLEHLGLCTLIITDIDAKDGATSASVVPKRGAGQKSRNETLKTWNPKEESLDLLLDKTAADKIMVDASGYAMRVAYQQPIQMDFKAQFAAEALANTFEDALVYENNGLFEKLAGSGLIAKFRNALVNCSDLADLAKEMSDALSTGNKAQFALDVLYSEEIKDLVVPTYINEGLVWLSEQLKRKEDDVVGKAAGVTP